MNNAIEAEGQSDTTAVAPYKGKVIDYVLGNTVRDKVSGFVGIALFREEWLTGTVHVAVQPKSSNTTVLPAAHVFDDLRLEFVDDGVVGIVQQAEECAISLGEEVQDDISGIAGHVTKLKTKIDGTIECLVESNIFDLNDPDAAPGTAFSGIIDHKRLTIVGPGFSIHSENPVRRTPTGCVAGAIHHQPVLV